MLNKKRQESHPILQEALDEIGAAPWSSHDLNA